MTGLTGAEPPVYPVSMFMADGMLNVNALGAVDGNACSAGPAPAARPPEPVPSALEPVETQPFNAAGVSIERLFLEENENASPRVIGFLPFNDRYAVEGNALYAVGWSEDKGYELVEVRDVGGPKVHDFNPEGSSFAGYPHYDKRTIKAFDGKLFFYSKHPGVDVELSSLKAGSARKDVDVDPSGSDIPRVYNNGGSLDYQSWHIDSFEIHRDMLMSAGSQRLSVQSGGLDLGDVRLYDIEPQRVRRGKNAEAEVADVYPDGPSLPRNMVEFNGAVYMIAKTAGGYAPCADGRDYELARLNDDGSSEIIEINPDGWGFYPDIEYPQMQVHAGNLYLVANLGAPGNERHELVKVTPSHEVSVVPVNPDGGAFANADEMWQYFFNWDEITSALLPLGDSLYVLGANIGGSCTAGCANPYEVEIVKIDAGGVLSVIDPTPGAGSTLLSWEPEYIAPTFITAEFNDDLYFRCGFCNEEGLFRLNADDSLEIFNEWKVSGIAEGANEVKLGVQRGDSFYMTTFMFQFEPEFATVEQLIRVDQDGSITGLESPDFGYEYVYNMVVLGDTIVAGANIFSDPEKDWETNWLGSELLLIHPDDSLGYVEVAPGFDEEGFPYSAFPYGLSVVGDSVIFASNTDPTYESPFYEMFRLHIGGKGKGPKNQSRNVSAESVGFGQGPQRVWPVGRPPQRLAGKTLHGGYRALRHADKHDIALPTEEKKAAGGWQPAALMKKPAAPDFLARELQQRGPGAEIFAAEARRAAETRSKARLQARSCQASPY